jgi:hypothetical protein
MTEAIPPTADTPVKRGRGRPPGRYGRYKKRKPEINSASGQLNSESESDRVPPWKRESHRQADGRWQKGLSGNPGGVSAAGWRIFSNLAVEARRYGNVALDNLVKLALHSESDTVKLGATVALLDRGFGRPTRTLDLRADIQSTAVNVIAELKPDDRRIMHETVKAITRRPEALALAIECMNDDGPLDTIPADVLDLEANSPHE